jgi:uncharacterized protein YbaR (Trm112 family)
MDKTLLDILACPSCKSAVNYHKEQQELTCPSCRLAYPIEDDIPVMLADQARELSAEETA